MKIKLPEWKLATKLIVVNLSAVLVLGIILGIVFVSFKNIETSVEAIVRKEMPEVIANGRIGNDLTGMFADLLIGVFLGQEDTVKTRSDRFDQTVTALAIRDTNPMLHRSLDRFRPELASLLDRSARIREISEKFDTMGSDIIFTLETLQDIIAERMERVEDADSTAMRHLELLKSTGTRYREVFLDISVQVADLRAGNAQPTIWEEHPIIADLNYFALSLETLPAADPEIAEQRGDLMKKTRDYRETVIRFLQTMAAFRKQLGDIGDSKENVMAILKHTNEEIADTSEDIRKRIDAGTRRTGRIIIILSAGIFFVILLITYSVLNTFRVESQARVLAGEMELARKIQTSLLPELTDSFHPDFQIAAAMLPADRVGGDFYDITYDRTGNLWLAVGDVSGHGVTPGLIMMMAQTAHATLTANIDCEARDAVVRLNEILYKNVRERLKESHFMTFTTLKYLGTGRFQHAGAHLRMIVWRQRTGACELVRTRGVYLNFKKNISKATKNAEFSLDPGDILVLYTDGLTEAENPDGKMLDLDGFVKTVEKHADQEPEAMKDMIMADVLRWCDGNRADDMTLVIIKRKMAEH